LPYSNFALIFARLRASFPRLPNRLSGS
jgi:hypothetical protein